MTTRANIVLRNSLAIRKEVFLYQHTDAHPNNMILLLSEMLRDSYYELKEHGDIDWFLNPNKLASFLIVKSAPKASEDMKEFMRTLPDATRYQLESVYYLGMPNFIVETQRVSNCNYEYIITLIESVEDNFFGYELEVHKLASNKLISVVLSHSENLLKDRVSK